VASERAFKVASDIANGARTRLKASHVRRLMFLKHNMKAIGYNTYKLPAGVALAGCPQVP
jgi:hypothetical protein